MSRIVGTIQGSDIVEEDDGSVTFSAGATLDGDGRTFDEVSLERAGATA